VQYKALQTSPLVPELARLKELYFWCFRGAIRGMPTSLTFRVRHGGYDTAIFSGQRRARVSYASALRAER